MAGGIDWFRWHHGSVTDPKFQLVAKKAGARLGDVITVWAFILEKASEDADRGEVGELDFETIDFLLGAEDGTAARILESMTARGLIAGNRIAAWEKRQPKRERDDDTAAERKRRQREREAASREQEAPIDADDAHVTPCHATSHQETPRGEESREEERKPSCASADARRPKSATTSEGFEQFWSVYPRKRSKGDAEKAWARIKPDAALLATILQAVEVAKTRDDWRKESGQFVPYPASWLNAKGWEDGEETIGKGRREWWIDLGYGDEAMARKDGHEPERAAA